MAKLKLHWQILIALLLAVIIARRTGEENALGGPALARSE